MFEFLNQSFLIFFGSAVAAGVCGCAILIIVWNWIEKKLDKNKSLDRASINRLQARCVPRTIGEVV